MVLAGLSAFLICACSSSAKHGSTGGASGASGGTGGSAGARAVDAATDGAPNDARHDAANDTGTSTPEEQACLAAFQAQCQILVACGFDTLEDCMSEAILCPDYYFSAASGLTVQGVTACLSEVAKITCTDWDLQLRPTCLIGGTRPPGAACVHATDCQSQGCTGRNKACGTCSDPPSATGQSCATIGCGPGDFCHPKTKLCTSGSTIVYANLGESCDLSASPVVGCSGSLHCIAAAAGTTAGICRPLLGNGESCAGTGAICGPALECDNQTTCQPIPAIPPSPTCGDAGVCDDATFCSGFGKQRSCVPRAAVGQVCSPDGGSVTTECVSPAVCLGLPGICTVYGNLGDACDSTTRPCGGLYLVCVSGRCGIFETSLCPHVPGDAGAD